MTLFSPVGSYPYPALADTPNAQTAGQLLTTALDATTAPHFASDAAVTTAIPTPSVGQLIMRTDIGYGTLMRYGHGRWIAESSLIAETSNNSGTVAFSSIPQYWRHLRVVLSGYRTTHSAGEGWGNIIINSDTTSGHYANTWTRFGYDGAVTQDSSANFVSSQASFTRAWMFVGADTDGNGGGLAIIDIPNYTQTSYKHSFNAFSCWSQGALNAMSMWASGGYLITGAINTLAFGSTDGWAFSASNNAALYGIS